MDFIKINYTGRIKDGQVFDTTDEELAKKENLHDAQRIYKPLSVAVGEGQVIAGLDEALAKMKVGEKQTVECDPDKAYGQRDSSMVKLVPVKFFKKEKISPVPGMPVEIDNMRGRVQTVSGGRVRVDFNPELAGKTLVFDVEVVDKAKSDKDKADYLIERNFEGIEGFDIKLAGKKLDIALPRDAFHDRNLMVRKASLSAEAFRFIGLDTVSYTETWENPKLTAEKKEKSQKGTEKKAKAGKSPQKAKK